MDAALVQIHGNGLDLRVEAPARLHQPFPAELRDQVRQVRTTPARCCR
ncbi:MAG: hypothetical protein U0736_06075 [Gemmataceae bacterium]